MVASAGTCRSPTVTTIVSRSSANCPGSGSTSEATDAKPSIVLRRGSIAQTTVRLAW